MKKKYTEEEIKILKSGWIPGSEFIILKVAIKLAIGIGAAVIGFTVMSQAINSGITEYKQIAEVPEYQRLAIVQVYQLLHEIEITIPENMANSLPPLETLTNIVNAAEKLDINAREAYFVAHRDVMLKLLKENSILPRFQQENLKVVVAYINDLLIKTNSVIDQIALDNFKKDIAHCHKYFKKR